MPRLRRFARCGPLDRPINEHSRLSLEQLGEKADVSPAGGSFDTYLSRLRTLELVEGRTELRASAELFG